jgi:hypothetical protein
MSARHIELWLNRIPCQTGLTLSLKTGLFVAPIAGHGYAYSPLAAFGSDPSRQSHERWLICRR